MGRPPPLLSLLTQLMLRVTSASASALISSAAMAAAEDFSRFIPPLLEAEKLNPLPDAEEEDALSSPPFSPPVEVRGAGRFASRQSPAPRVHVHSLVRLFRHIYIYSLSTFNAA